MPSSSPVVITPITPDREYFWEDGDILFDVENTSFRVHSFWFKRDVTKFPLPAPLSREELYRAPPGTPRYHCKVSDAPSAHFALLLWVFYNRTLSVYEASIDDWVIILGLANRWGFHQVKQLVVRELERKDMDPITRIALYRENEIDEAFLVPAYVALCERPATISKHEGERLGMEVVVPLVAARERVQERRSIAHLTGAELDEGVVKEIICKIFDIPFATTLHSTRSAQPAWNGVSSRLQHGIPTSSPSAVPTSSASAVPTSSASAVPTLGWPPYAGTSTMGVHVNGTTPETRKLSPLEKKRQREREEKERKERQASAH
ncbi:hypothetical protein PLICRDRAFT_177560 [Plicaturopsis crispa FD-325 SS-3]|nr:hypothetical protein PLICRDRAFT_177560 [Plicaturopsis crispa FD-325 SS-3]